MRMLYFNLVYLVMLMTSAPELVKVTPPSPPFWLLECSYPISLPTYRHCVLFPSEKQAKQSTFPQLKQPFQFLLHSKDVSKEIFIEFTFLQRKARKRYPLLDLAKGVSMWECERENGKIVWIKFWKNVKGTFYVISFFKGNILGLFLGTTIDVFKHQYSFYNN